MSSSLALDHLASGKVRELYDAGEGRLLLVASDRISAFDVVLPTPIPDKGRVLTALSLHWFALTDDIVRNHVISARVDEFPEGARDPGLAGRALLVRRLEMLPLECVVRGYLAGSGWKDYGRTGAVCGIPLPDGLREADRLPRTLFTPSTKATTGHDENITAEQGIELVGEQRYREVERASIALYERAAASALERGIILADTKFEFGIDADGVAGGRRRGADARLVALLARRQLCAGLLAAVLRQAVRARLAGDPALGQDAARARAAGRGARRHRRSLSRCLRTPRRTPVRELPRGDGGEQHVKVTVLVRPKDGILDPQGEAIRQALSTLGYPASSVRAGRLFDVELDVSDPAEAERIGREAADRVLANGLIEGYEVVVEGVAGAEDSAEVAAEDTAEDTEEVAAE